MSAGESSGARAAAVGAQRPEARGSTPGGEEDPGPGVRGWIWLDGRLTPATGPHLSVADRGFQLGDGIFETLRARRGVAIELDEHLARLHESAAALALRLPSDAELVRGIERLLAAQGLADEGSSEASSEGVGVRGMPGDAALRITVTRGAIAGRGLLPAARESVAATVAIQAWPYAPPAADLLERGVSAILSRIRRDPASPLAAVKTTSRADHVYAKLEAERAGADDAIVTTIDGRLSEATTANLFLVSGSQLSTPPMSAGILAGTTRTWLLAEGRAGRLTACGTSLSVEERDLVPADLLGAGEAFLSSSVAGMVPLTRFEGRPIGDGRPGAITRELRAAREAWIDRAALAALADRTDA